MASVFGHSIVALTIGKMLPKSIQSSKLFILGTLASILPDADVVAFKFGIPYSHILGHRGFTHSILFGLFIAFFFHFLFLRRISQFDGHKIWRIFYLFVCCASHGLIDAMTSGGRGIALLFPFTFERYFFPYRPILVSPLGASNFFSEWGVQVLISEALWIGIPCLFLLIIKYFWKPSK